MVNTLVLNSAYSVTYAVYGMRHEGTLQRDLRKMSEAEILEQFRATQELLGDRRELLGMLEIPTLVHQEAGMRRERPLNLVIILEESLGATFGIARRRAGDAGNRETEEGRLVVRAAVRDRHALGARHRGRDHQFPAPTPAQAVVKLSLAQRNFSTLAGILGRQGYESEFIYGGESHFDNMRGFFLANGFSQVTDENDS